MRTLLAPEGTDWWDAAAQKFNINNEAGVKAMQLFAETPVQMGIETELDQNHADAAMAGKVALARGLLQFLLSSPPQIRMIRA